MKRFISFSGGVESTTMCILYGKGATAIWCDTGSEHREMYERIDMVEQKLKDLHKGDFELIRVRPEVKHKGEMYSGLEELAIAYKYLPSGQKRYCTRLFKSEAVDQAIKGAGECELMIGFNADEEGREGSLEAMPNVKYSYPLIEAGLTRDDCEEILNLHGLHPNFPVYMLRGGCRICFFKSEKEYKAMYHLNPEEFEEIIKLEETIQDKRKKFFSIMPSGKSMRQLKAECDQEKALFFNVDWSDIYKSKKKQKTCGAFCNR